MATARPAAAPARADITMPSPPFGPSSKSPVKSPIFISSEVTESPGSAARWLAPFRSGEVMFIGARQKPRNFRHLVAGDRGMVQAALLSGAGVAVNTVRVQ